MLSLGSSRRDTNSERGSVLSEINAALADYDEFIERNRRMLGFEPASCHDVVNLQTWVDGNSCIAREETAYLSQVEDLLGVASPDDNAMTWLRELVENIRVYFRERFSQHHQLD
ncbi:hypothetical protein AJ79_06678 [Helicocarpus griseus UAMH5409]|uniref:DUF6594 domain-containing protein n=1 Tax=Helicocarpus griseus UAMH5409 TaxID=1447875 RepID=A0A2B7XAW3_9EURO|nr:hypothetical protein AJ79_06678 [Helicocarpus griseus UAMH5409]